MGVAVSRNRTAEALVEDLSQDGRGVARIQGKTVFVRDALPGERVTYSIRRRRRSFDEAELDGIIEASSERVDAGCPHFGVCGGCTLQHLAPGAQLATKRGTVAENLHRIGGVAPRTWLDPLTGPLWGYRRRARLSVKRVKGKDRTLVGFRERDGRFVADIDSCPVLEPAVGERLQSLAGMLDGLDAAGSIPQVEVAVGDNAAALVFRHMQPLSAADRERLEAWADGQGIVPWLQPGGPETAAPMRDDAPELLYRLPEHDVTVGFLPTDFTQVNATVNRALVDRAVSLLDPGPADTVLDLFCGLGNFTLPLARRAGGVIGVEGDASLLERARENAARNDIRNASFCAEDLSMVPEHPQWLGEAPDRVMLDPPRTGARMVLNRFRKRRPRRIVYVSCHPGTLARDAGFLVNELGYDFSACGIADMFPHTAHVETIAVFDA